MQRYFLLRASPTELTAICCLLLMSAILSLIYLDPGVERSIYLVAIILLAIGEIRHPRFRQKLYLVISDGRVGLIANRGQQPYFSSKNKVYRCRWFAILKLYDRHKNRTEILFPDRFITLRAYRECRFLLSRLQVS